MFVEYSETVELSLAEKKIFTLNATQLVTMNNWISDVGVTGVHNNDTPM